MPTNLYFDNATQAALPKGQKARAESVDAKFDAITAGFDLLPTPNENNRGTRNYAVDTGAANAYVVTTGHIDANNDGQELIVRIGAGNTNAAGACTINPDGVGATPIKTTAGTDPVAGVLAENSIARFRYNSANSWYELEGVFGITAVVSAFMATMLDDADASTALSTLGFSAFAKTIIDDADASTALSTLGFSAFFKTLIDDADSAAARATLLAAGLTVANIFTKTQSWAKGADVASASALTLGTDGNYFDITGTTEITSIGTLGVGTIIKLHFDDVLTLTNHATNLVLPGGVDIITYAGDEAEFVEYATGQWRCVNYQTSPNLVDEIIVSGGAVTQIDFTGLDIDTHKGYRVEIDLINATASAATLSMYANGDTTATNYYTQSIGGSSTTPFAQNSNSAGVCDLPASNTAKASISLSLVNDIPTAIDTTVYNTGTSLSCATLGWRKTATLANITQLTFVSSVANALANGTRIRIYREDI